MTAIFRTSTDIHEAQIIWEQLSRPHTIYGDWQFRHIFYRYFNYPIVAIIAEDAGAPVGLLLLQHNTDKGYWEFFGGSYMEDNQVLLVPGYESLVPEFFARVPKPAKLYSIIGDTPFVTGLPIEADKFTLSLGGLQTFEDYLAKFHDADDRGKFRRKLRKVEREQITVRHDEPSDMDIMVTFNKLQFTDHSAFVVRAHLVEIFKDLTKCGWPVHLYGFLRGNEPVAASFALVYRGVYEYFNLGTNPDVEHDNLRDLATFVHAHNVTAAIAAGCHTLDAFTRSYGWKEHWRFVKTPQHEFINE